MGLAENTASSMLRPNLRFSRVSFKQTVAAESLALVCKSTCHYKIRQHRPAPFGLRYRSPEPTASAWPTPTDAVAIDATSQASTARSANRAGPTPSCCGYPEIGRQPRARCCLGLGRFQRKNQRSLVQFAATMMRSERPAPRVNLMPGEKALLDQFSVQVMDVWSWVAPLLFGTRMRCTASRNA